MDLTCLSQYIAAALLYQTIPLPTCSTLSTISYIPLTLHNTRICKKKIAQRLFFIWAPVFLIMIGSLIPRGPNGLPIPLSIGILLLPKQLMSRYQ